MFDDPDKMENLLRNISSDLNDSMITISDFRKEELARLEEIQSELAYIDHEIKSVINEKRRVLKEYKQARDGLSKVTRAGTESEQLKIYEITVELMKKKGILLEAESNLRSLRDSLELEKRRVYNRLNRGEDIGSRIRIALKIVTDRLKDNFDDENLTISALERGYSIAERESRSLARDLHDGPAQRFSGAIMLLDLARKLLNLERYDQCKVELEKAREQMIKTMEEIRSFLFVLYPREVQEGLDKALVKLAGQLSSRYKVAISIDRSCDVSFIPEGMRSNIFKVVHQALINGLSKGRPSKMSVSMYRDGELLCIKVVDDGIGFDVDEVKRNAAERGSYGLLSMDERARMMGGKLEISSESGQGTAVSLYVPIKDD